MSILERIYFELDKQGIKPIRLCEHLGISTGLLSTWKKRGTEPKAKYIKPIAEFLGVSESYLLTGSDVVDSSEQNRPQEDANISPELKELFDVCKKIRPEDIKLVTEMIKRMSQEY